jgi:hypothetical protein
VVDKEWFQDESRMLLEAKEILKRKFNIDHTTIQVESEQYSGGASVAWKS